MSGVRESWQVAAREVRERLRTPAYWLSLVLMVVVVAGAIVIPSFLDDRGGTKDVGLSGSTPSRLGEAIVAQGDAAGHEIRIHRYASVESGERAVQDDKVDVLVVGESRLEWQRRPDADLKSLVTGAIQLVVVRERAVQAGLDPDQLLALVRPVPVEDVELGQVHGRSAEDETATYLLSVVLFLAVSFYGALVLNGVVEEKSSRVVEVLLARIPARNLLAGKIAGIGLLGLAQVLVTGVVALVAIAWTGFAEIPAARPGVIAWAVVWFVLGYALIATAYGVLGSLASRTEDATSMTGPISAILIAAYFVSFAAIGSPDTTWARLASWFPVTAPFAMPNRIAMGAVAWWEPVVAVALTVAAIGGLVVLGGRVYEHAVLHTSGVLGLGEAWRGAQGAAARTPSQAHRRSTWAAGLAAAATGSLTIALTHDVVMGVTAAAVVFTLAYRYASARTRPRPR